MTTTDPFERLVATWLEREGPQQAPAGLAEAAFASARGAGQRRGLQATLTGPGGWPARTAALGWPALSPVLRIALVGLAVLATVGASLLVASRLQKPAPLHLLGVVEPTGSMDQPRFQPQATLLLDGTVLVTGGAGDLEVLSAELYDPGKGVFEPVGSMGTGSARARVVSQVRLSDGRVLVVGSTGGDHAGLWPYTRFALLYDPSTRSFSPATQALDPAFEFEGLTAEILSDGRVRWGGGPGSNRTVWYDPKTGSFSGTETTAVDPAPDVTTARVWLDDGRQLLIGYLPNLHPNASIYDPATGSLTNLEAPPIIAGSQQEATVLPDGRVLLLDGLVTLFDPTTEQFTALDAAADHFAAWTADGRAVLTDQAGWGFGATGQTNLWIFDPATDTVTAGARVPDTCCTAWTSLSDGRVLGVGGLAGEHPSGTAVIVR